MKMKKLGIRLGLIAATLSALASCASAPRAAEVQLPDPKTVPREKWSDAMIVLNAMGIEGQRDIPKEMAGSVPGTIVRGSFVSGGVADIASAGISYSNPPAGFSGGGVLAMGAGLFLLGGGGSPAAGLTQVAAWVPAELASSPQEANKVVAAEWDKARKAVGRNGLSKVSTVTAKYHRGYDPRKMYPSITDKILKKPAQYDAPAHKAPSFIAANNVYGPIFLMTDQIDVDAARNNIELTKYIEQLSQALPEWFFFYYPGLKERNRFFPAAVYNKEKIMHFIGK